jgi:multiple sugar transport system permease protein
MATLKSGGPAYGSGRSWRVPLRRAAVFALMVALAVLFIFPIWFMVVTAFKPDSLAVRDMSSLMAFVPRFSSPEVPAPEDWTPLANFRDVFRRLDMVRLTANSLLIAGGVIAGRLIVDSMAAYALSRLRWRGQRLLLAVVIALIIIPFEVVAIPLLLMVNRFGWINSYQVQIIPFISSPLSIYLFYQFFLNFPSEIEEASRIDGASYLRTFTSIVVPSAAPVFATVSILAFLDIWGSFLWPLMVTRDSTFRPVMLGLFVFFEQQRQWGDIMAFASLVTIPVLLLFLLFQRWFVQSVATTGIKG